MVSLKISNKSYNWNPINIMTVVTRAKETLKRLEVHPVIREWTPAAMEKLGGLENLTSLTLTYLDNTYYTYYTSWTIDLYRTRLLTHLPTPVLVLRNSATVVVRLLMG